FLIICTIVNNRLSITIYYVFVDIGVDVYIFVNKRFNIKLKKLGMERYKDFTPGYITSYKKL
ncbi:hypothetical protein QBC45DRAFT_340190, partial [Copromyces sp. CBS 386.78]